MRIKNFTLNEQRQLTRLLKLNYSLTEISKETERDKSTIKSAAEKLGYKYINKEWVR